MEKAVVYLRFSSKDQVEGEWVNCGNHFTESRFENFCKVLEKEGIACVHVDCIGHSNNNYVQEEYKKHLVEKYGDKLLVDYIGGLGSYYYRYVLKGVS